jgi:hypothetical protein
MRLGKKIVMVMKKTYNKPAINILQIIAPQMLMVSVEHRGWAKDGTFNDEEKTHKENMGDLDHDVEFNIWKQGDEGWADLD